MNATALDKVGGLIGHNSVEIPGTVRDSYATGKVVGDEDVGGLVGYNVGDLVIDSYATGDVTGTKDVGGLVGHNHEGTIEKSSATGNLVEFKVSKEWIEENNIDPSTIRMTRFHDGEWQDLPSNQVGEDDEYLHFNANTPGFSIFSIVGDEMKEEVIEEEPATEQQSPSEEVEEPASEEESAQTPGFTAIFAVALIAGAAFVMRKD